MLPIPRRFAPLAHRTRGLVVIPRPSGSSSSSSSSVTVQSPEGSRHTVSYPASRAFLTCTCEDWVRRHYDSSRQGVCKHILAVILDRVPDFVEAFTAQHTRDAWLPLTEALALPPRKRLRRLADNEKR
jgi:hypothetical protein